VEWVVLGLLAETPAHGWSLVRALQPGGDVGRVWSSSRPLVYRALETLGDRRLAHVTKSEPSPAGPVRTIFAPTSAGRRAVERWLATPVQHVRDIRAELMVKLLLHDRAGTSPQMLLDRQAEILSSLEKTALDHALGASGFEHTLALWRLSSTREARHFVADLVGVGSRAAVVYSPIGFVRSAYQTLPGMPLQAAADDLGGARIVVDHPYRQALADLDGFSHVWVVAHLHRVVGWAPRVVPFLDDSKQRGVFATRSPQRPNPISISLARIVRVGRSVVELEGIDLLDDTPVLDIKPYVSQFDSAPGAEIGWFKGRAEHIATVRADDRFAGDPETMPRTRPRRLAVQDRSPD
jgi:tRNA-Thr(GGU) m(6)t(6)A37 methyltransferase TsaA